MIQDSNSYFKLLSILIFVTFLTLHWILKSMSYFMFPRSPSVFTDIKIANVFNHPNASLKYEFHSLYKVYFKFYIIKQMSLIIFHPTPSAIHIKGNISFVTEVLEQPGGETREHNIVAIRECRHAYVDKKRTLLADIDVTPPRGAVHVTCLFNVLHREMQAAKTVGFI